MKKLVSSCIWRVSSQLLLTIQERLGDPVDSHVNGAQVWLREDEPDSVTLEWRLHPVAHYIRPVATTTYSIFSATTFALANKREPPAPLHTLWDGLEAFVAFGDAVEPIDLMEMCNRLIGCPPDIHGMVDHDAIATSWEKSGGGISITENLIAQLQPS